MIARYYFSLVQERLWQFPIVALVGPRQVGKTTLATMLGATCASLYLDLENYNDLAKLEDPIAFLSAHQDKLIILDEIQRKPELFVSLRGLVDQAKRTGQKNRTISYFGLSVR